MLHCLTMSKAVARSIAISILPIIVSINPVKSNNFDVYCTSNGDQTTTCSGWEGDQGLTCVSNVGGSLSCKASSGQSFVCVDNLGTASCTNQNVTNSQTTQCTFDGGGTSSCAQPEPQSAPLIEAPSIAEPSIEIPENLITPSLSLPSVFWYLKQLLATKTNVLFKKRV